MEMLYFELFELILTKTSVECKIEYVGIFRRIGGCESCDETFLVH